MINCYNNEILSYFNNNKNLICLLVDKFKETILFLFTKIEELIEYKRSKTEFLIDDMQYKEKEKSILLEIENKEKDLLGPIKFMKEFLNLIKDSIQLRKNFLDLFVKDYNIINSIFICITYFPNLNRFYQFVRNQFSKRMRKSVESNNYKFKL